MARGAGWCWWHTECPFKEKLNMTLYTFSFFPFSKGDICSILVYASVIWGILSCMPRISVAYTSMTRVSPFENGRNEKNNVFWVTWLHEAYIPWFKAYFESIHDEYTLPPNSTLISRFLLVTLYQGQNPWPKIINFHAWGNGRVAEEFSSSKLIPLLF